MKYYRKEDINATIPECSAYEYIRRINGERLDKNALNYFGRKTTFREMFRQIDICANALKAYGVKRGEIISVSLPNIPEAVYLFYAISKIGAVANMIDPRTSSDGIADYLNETQSTKLFVIDLIAEKINEIKEKTALENVITVSPANSMPVFLRMLLKAKSIISGPDNPFTKWNKFMKSSVSETIETIDEEELSRLPVMIVHTGGTTGLPKGVLLSNRNVNAIPFQSLQFPTDLQSKHVWLDIMPPFIAYGIGSGLHFPLAIGTEVVLIPAFKPEEFDKLVDKYRPNHIAGAPSHWNSVIHSKRLAKKDLSFLITCVVGGDSISPNLEEAANRFLQEHNCSYKIAKGYGMSEVNGSIGRTTNTNNPQGTAGIPFAHSIVKICDPDTGEELKYNKVGEIYMSGPSVMMSYYNNPEETDKIKVIDENGIEWIKSGDLGYMTEDGNLYIQGRIKRMIIRYDGFKVFPSMIESVLIKHPAVEEVCVVRIKDKDHVQGELPAVFAVYDHTYGTEEKTIEDLTQLCKKELPEYVQPSEWHFIDKMPLTPIGKTDYRELERRVS